jgi:hypothetical protein
MLTLPAFAGATRPAIVITPFSMAKEVEVEIEICDGVRDL